MDLAAFCALNSMDSLIPMLYSGAPEDVLFAEAVADRVERALIEAKERG